MPRYRTIKPEHWSDDQLPNISLQAELLWIGTWNFSDDDGIFEDDPWLIRSQIFPRRKEIRIEDITKWLDQLVKARYILPFSHGGKGYYITRSFKAHQRIDKPQTSKIPSDIIRIALQEHSENVPRPVSLESRVEESNVKESSDRAPVAPTERSNESNLTGKKFIPPTQKELSDYFILLMGDTTKAKHWPEDKCVFQAGKMWDHYKSNGWVQGRGKAIKDWQAAARIWMRNSIEGTFDKAAPAAREQPKVPRIEDTGPKLTPLQEELNYLYSSWLEGEERVTIISVSSDQYNLLKSARLISFTEQESENIKAKAIAYMTEKAMTGDIAMIRLMKGYGVLEYFKQLKARSAYVVFEDPAQKRQNITA